MEKLKNKTVLITGASKGIGFGIAEALIKNNMNVALTSRNHQAADEAAKQLNKLGKGEAMAIEADVRNGDAQQRAVDQVIKKWGKLEVLVANAGIGYFYSIEKITDEQWHETIDTNLTGVFYSVKASIPALKESKGYII